MLTFIEGMPSELVEVDVQTHAVVLRIDAALYSLSSLYAAAYIFIDRCFVLLDKPDAHYRVTLSWER